MNLRKLIGDKCPGCGMEWEDVDILVRGIQYCTGFVTPNAFYKDEKTGFWQVDFDTDLDPCYVADPYYAECGSCGYVLLDKTKEKFNGLIRRNDKK